jgi:hypothetical protein
MDKLVLLNDHLYIHNNGNNSVYEQNVLVVHLLDIYVDLLEEKKTLHGNIKFNHLQ